MKRKNVIPKIAVIILLAACSSASADMVEALAVVDSSFAHVVDFYHWRWNPCFGWYTRDGVTIYQGSPLVYEHDLNADGLLDVPGTHIVTDADLELTFKRDKSDSHGKVWTRWFHIKWDFREWVWLRFDGDSFINVGEMDATTYDVAVDLLPMINDDGVLSVKIGVWNPLGNADIGIVSSVLTGDFETVPVPGAVLLGMLGLSAVGVKLRKFA